tara:strand:- start:18116 stop:18370 length:255 start_codon:yes stop_codon:yes gene_type:complete
MAEQTQNPDGFKSQDGFKNRRRMAYLSVGSLVAILATMCGDILFNGGHPNDWTGIASAIILCFTGITGTYMGSATYENVKGVSK